MNTSSLGPGAGARPPGSGERLLLVAVPAQLVVAFVVVAVPLVMYCLVDKATQRAMVATPSEAVFIDGYGAPARFTYGAMTVMYVAYGLVVAVLAVRCVLRASISQAALGMPWLGLVLLLCAGAANPNTTFDFGEPDGYSLVHGPDGYGDWLIPTLAGSSVLIGFLALTNTIAAVRSRRRAPEAFPPQ